MDKEARLELMKARFKKLDAERGIVSDAIIPISKRDIQDEVNHLNGFGEFTQNKEKHLTSDEK